ncbi:hypothetical protein ACVMH6_002138 [Rhizobium leguminosarum]
MVGLGLATAIPTLRSDSFIASVWMSLGQQVVGFGGLCAMRLTGSGRGPAKARRRSYSSWATPAPKGELWFACKPERAL